jgi:hypothetical protein
MAGHKLNETERREEARRLAPVRLLYIKWTVQYPLVGGGGGRIFNIMEKKGLEHPLEEYQKPP